MSDLDRKVNALGVDLSDYSDEFVQGFVAGAEHVQAGEVARLRSGLASYGYHDEECPAEGEG